MRLAIWILLLAIWETAYRIIQWPDFKFPAPSHILDELLRLLNVNAGFGDSLHPGWPKLEGVPWVAEGGLFKSPLIWGTFISCLRLLEGFIASIVLGIGVGALMWRFKPVNAFIGPVALGLQTLPSVCWIPLAIILAGYSESGIMFVMIAGSLFAIAIALRDGFQVIPPLYQRAGLMLGAKGWRMYRYVLLPAALPAMASGLRQGFSFAWRSLMGGEVVMGSTLNPKGLGALLNEGRDSISPAEVLAIMLIMVLIGMTADRLVFAPLERAVARRFGLQQVG